MSRRSLAVAVAALTLAACGGDAPLVARTEEPMLYVVLTPDTLTPSDTLVTALLGTTGTPVRFEYRAADRFAMRRASDGASFAWRELEIPADRVGPGLDYLPAGANYALARAGGPAGLGRGDLAPGETYVLEVSTGGRSITGAVTIPARPRLVLSERGDGTRVVSWQRDPGVGEYIVQSDIDAVPDRASADTFYVLRGDRDPRSRPPRPRFHITAVDTSLARYLRDPRVTSAGLAGAYGVLGARTSATLDLPSGAATSRDHR